jgi:CubicO group peptidase (beta-lactamase class C family)
MTVLGDVIAKTSRMPFEGYVQKEILEPLKMTSSTLLYDGLSRQAWAAGHTRTAGGGMTVIPHYPYNRAHAPSSTLHSSAVDMSRWIRAMLNGGELDGRRILLKASLDGMWRPTIEAREGRIGLAWQSLAVQGKISSLEAVVALDVPPVK